MRISVVIPCLNEERTLPALFEALRAQDATLDEIIVVDNGSRDRSRDVVLAEARRDASRPVRLLECATPGAAAALNAGIREASGDAIVRLDGHCRPRPDYVRLAVDHLRDEKVGVVGGVWDVEPGDGSRSARAIADVLASPLATGGASYRHPGRSGAPASVDTVPFGCYRASVWRQLGGYDEALTVNEDYAFNYKARLAGFDVLLDPAIRSTYFARPTFGRLARQYFQYGSRKVAMLRVYPRSIRVRQILPAALVAALVILGLLAPFGRGWAALFAGSVTLYALTLLAASVQVAAATGRWSMTVAYVVAFATIQLCWGAGAWMSVMRERSFQK